MRAFVLMHDSFFHPTYRTNGWKCFVSRWKCRMIETEEYDRCVNQHASDCSHIGKSVARQFNGSANLIKIILSDVEEINLISEKCLWELF